MSESPNIRDAVSLIRHQLGSVDLSDVATDEEMLESERKEYCAAISAVFPRLERDIKKFIYEQIVFMARGSADWNQVMFGRGTVNGFDLLLDHWRLAHNENMEKSQPKNFDKNSPIGEVG